jgi:hypothetical protein
VTILTDPHSSELWLLEFLVPVVNPSSFNEPLEFLTKNVCTLDVGDRVGKVVYVSSAGL